MMRHTLHQSEAGQLTVPMVIDALSAVGVESYFADLTRRTDTFYMPNGETHVEAMNHPPTKIAEDFSKLEIVAAIRAAQADQIAIPSSSNGQWQPAPRPTGSSSPAGKLFTLAARAIFTLKISQPPNRNPAMYLCINELQT